MAFFFVIVFFLVLSAGGFFCAAVWGKPYARVTPVWCVGLILLQFLFALPGWLRVGTWTALLLAAAAYLVGTLVLLHRSSLESLRRGLRPLPILLFFFALCLIAGLNYGRLAAYWDEFSHWADVVRAMTLLDDLGTNPAAYADFASYPPGMALFQYFAQQLWCMLGGGDYCEWLLYFASQALSALLFLPFLDLFPQRRPLPAVLAAAAFAAAPMLLFADAYTTVYIDAFLGILSGTALGYVILCPTHDLPGLLHVLFCAALLVLTKDVGLLFAAFLILAFLFTRFSEPEVRHPARKWLPIVASAILAVALPKLLWSWKVSVSGADVRFGEQVEPSLIFRVLTGQDESWRPAALRIYWQAVLARKISLGWLCALSFCGMFLLFGTVLWLLCRKRQRRAAAVVTLMQTAAYTIGLGFTYLFNEFTEAEALTLASFERYLGAGMLALMLPVLLTAADTLRVRAPGKTAPAALLLAAVLILSPADAMRGLLTRTSVQTSIDRRAPYAAMTEAITAAVPAGKRVYLISQGAGAFDYRVLKYTVRPVKIHYRFIGGGCYDEPWWTIHLTADEWRAELMAKYDYVALYQVDEFFCATYAGLFADPIEAGAVYAVDRATGILYRVQ